jgi:hypothetical protein
MSGGLKLTTIIQNETTNVMFVGRINIANKHYVGVCIPAVNTKRMVLEYANGKGNIVVHEIGHLAGASISTDTVAIMYERDIPQLDQNELNVAAADKIRQWQP